MSALYLKPVLSNGYNVGEYFKLHVVILFITTSLLWFGIFYVFSFSRGLPTGHISGPDYCIRPTISAAEVNTDTGSPDNKYYVHESGSEHISLLVQSKYCSVSILFEL